MSEMEQHFIERMLKDTPYYLCFNSKLPDLMVAPMNDGGMGGLTFISKKQDRKIGLDIASYEFIDDDGVKVIAKLSLDNYGDIYELDVWKTDFSKLIRFP
ncbi:MAG: hypothetical protein QM772_05780 [Ottowia sp.]|uniref:DUF6984 family protein n=1 Tax=Ottowia sp. TaxID=1898956 RepID=UPI0039E2E7CE